MVIVGVKNLEASIDFYKNILKCEVMKRFSPNPDTEIAFMLYNKEIEIELLKRKDMPIPENSISPIMLAFKTHNVEADYETLQLNNIKCEGKPISLPSGIKVVRFFDPNGVSITFMEE
jgi:lactoylglutathione lyase